MLSNWIVKIMDWQKQIEFENQNFAIKTKTKTVYKPFFY